MTNARGRIGRILILGSALLMAGCPKPPATNSKDTEPSLGAHVKRGKEKLIAENDFSQMGQFYHLYYAERGRAPTMAEFKTYIQQEAPNIYKPIEKGTYTIVAQLSGGRNPVLAYETEKDLNGSRVVLRSDGSVSTMNEEDFKTALEGK
jgi:hypothetical protein